MTVQLACRLLESKLLLRSEVALCLRESTLRGIAFVQALVERVPSAAALLESEFARWNGPTIATLPLPVDVEVALQLPLGMCERFLALPLVRKSDTEPVRLAVVDPFDTHVLAEFRYCLGRAVTPLRTPFSHLIYALATVHGNVPQATERASLVPPLGAPSPEGTPAFGTPAAGVARQHRRTRDFGESAHATGRRGYTLPTVDSTTEPSEPPLPLVRTTMAPGPLALGPVQLGQGTLSAFPPNPPPSIANTSTAPSMIAREATEPVGAGASRGSRESEPVLTLVKQKSAALRASIPPPPRSPDITSISPEVLLEGLEKAESPRQLLERMHEALKGTVARHAFLSVRGDTYVVELASHPVESGRFAPTDEQQNLLRTACRAGYFLGPLPTDRDALGLASVLKLKPGEEIYAAPVNVKNRAALVLVVGQFDEAFSVTRWVDAIVSRAGQVLERLARAKKQR